MDDFLDVPEPGQTANALTRYDSSPPLSDQYEEDEPVEGDVHVPSGKSPLLDQPGDLVEIL